MKNKCNIQPYNFHRGNIFYPLVMNYIYSIHGFIDLASRGLINKLTELRTSKTEDKINDVINSLNIKDDTIKNQFKETYKTHPLFAKQQFLKSDGEKIEIDINEFGDEILTHGAYLASALYNSACILLISAFEKTRDLDDKKDPIWNFFYHCRNASAHNNKFRIEKDRFPAKWRNLEVTKEMNGSKLFKENESSNGFLNFGDPIELLWDIEQKYSSMKIK